MDIKLEKQCQTCNNVFEKKYFKSKNQWLKTKYCSRVCYVSRQDKKINIKCDICSVSFIRTPSIVGKYCSNKCKGRGKWIEDRTLLKTSRFKAYDTQYKYWMRGVKNRDGWKCKISNSDCSGRLEAHHILPWRSHPELRYELNNGITLCVYHHPRKESEEARLSPYFFELVGKDN